MEIGLGPSDFNFDGDAAPLPEKKSTAPSKFWPMSMAAKRLDGSRCHLIGTEVNLGPGDVVLDGLQLSLKGAQPQFSVHVYCEQTAGWMKMPLGTEVDLDPGHIVLDGDAAPRKGHRSHPLFSSMSIVATVAHLSYC